MKFYDKGFISKYQNFTKVEVFNAGVAVLSLKLYDNQVCHDTFECQSSKVFNAEYLSTTYKENFLKELFEKKEKEIIFRDKKNGILIKIKKD